MLGFGDIYMEERYDNTSKDLGLYLENPMQLYSELSRYNLGS